jgi:hypothetical protein
MRIGTGPKTGPYYWFPSPSDGSLSWSVLAAHDFELDADTGHDELWPFVLEHLAVAWGKDPAFLKRRLSLFYTGLPRGRVTKPEKLYLILHGNDAPIPSWEELVTESFHLSKGKIKTFLDEHETQIQGHSEAFNKILNVRSSNHPT